MIADVFCEKIFNAIWKADNNYLLIVPTIWYLSYKGTRHCLLIIKDGMVFIFPELLSSHKFLLSDPDCFDKVIKLIRGLRY